MITYQVEAASDVIDEMIKYNTMQWEEIKFFPHLEEELDIDIQTIMLASDSGHYVVLTARDNEKLIGYLTVVASHMLHHKEALLATEDAMYVDPDYRKQGIAQELLSRMITICSEAGVKYFSMTVTPTLDYSKLLERNGFTKGEVTYTRKL